MNKKKLVDMVKKGVPDKEIMRELGIQTKASLKRMYYDALVEAGKIKGIMTESKMKKARKGEPFFLVTNYSWINLVSKREISLQYQKGGIVSSSKNNNERNHLSLLSFLMVFPSESIHASSA
jgi:hypothetical protein